MKDSALHGSKTEAFVNVSPAGYFVAELEDALHVPVQDPCCCSWDSKPGR